MAEPLFWYDSAFHYSTGRSEIKILLPEADGKNRLVFRKRKEVSQFANTSAFFILIEISTHNSFLFNLP